MSELRLMIDTLKREPLAVIFAICLVLCLTADFFMARVNPIDSDSLQSYNELFAIRGGNILLHGWILSSDNFYFTDTLPDVVLSLLLGSRLQLIYIAPFLGFSTFLLGCLLLATYASESKGQRYFGLFAILFLVGLPYGLGLDIFLKSCFHLGTIIFCLYAILFAAPALLGRRFNYWRLIPFSLLVFMTAASDPFGDVFCIGPLLGLIPLRALMYRRVKPDEWALFGCAALAGSFGIDFVKWLSLGAGFSVVSAFSTSLASHAELGNNAYAILRALQALFSARADLLNAIQGHRIIAETRLICGLAAIVLSLRVIIKMPALPRNGISQLLVFGALTLTVADLVSQSFADSIVSIVWFPGTASRYVTPVYVFIALTAAIEPQNLVSSRFYQRLRQIPLSLRMAMPAIFMLPFLLGGAQTAVSTARQPSDIVASEKRPLTEWLLAHHLQYGIGDYWTSEMIQGLSRNRIKTDPAMILPVKLSLMQWHCDAALWAKIQPPQFVAFTPGNLWGISLSSIEASYGKPQAVYKLGTDTVALMRGAR